MNDKLALKKIGLIEAQMESMSNTLKVLKQELIGSGASVSSARKGKNEATQKKINQVLAKRKADKMKKATGGR